MQLYQTIYTASDGGLWPLKIKGRVYNASTSTRLISSKDGIRTLYRKRNGEYWLHIMISGVGHYIAPVNEKEGELQQALLEKTWAEEE